MKKLNCFLPCMLLLALVWSSAGAQTCASPTTISSGGNVSGDTTTGDTSVGSVCGGITLTGPVNVYTWTNSGGAMSGSLTVTPSNGTYDAGLALGDGASCTAALGTCDGTADANGAGGAESLPLGSLALNKTYFLFVSSFASGGATTTAGPYNLAVGTLPVKLQKFSVK